VPVVREGCEHVYHLYVVRVERGRRDALRDFLGKHQVATGIHYPVPIHLQPAYRGRLGDTGSFPVAEQAAREIVSLPLYPQLAVAAVERVAELIAAFE